MGEGGIWGLLILLSTCTVLLITLSHLEPREKLGNILIKKIKILSK